MSKNCEKNILETIDEQLIKVKFIDSIRRKIKERSTREYLMVFNIFVP